MRTKYKKKSAVTAVKLDLETQGFQYQKWGDTQQCNSGDWIVNSEGDTYTIQGNEFDNTYEYVSPGVYSKKQRIWAEKAAVAGKVKTLEGFTHYQAGDYLISKSQEDGFDYAISKAKFETLYAKANN